MCAVTLGLTAKNPFPWVEIPPTIDMGPCLVSHELAFLLPVHSKGAGAAFRLSSTKIDRDEDTTDTSNSNNILEVNQFIAYPEYFKLKKDESGDVVILFIPQSTGHFTFDLTVATPCGHEWSTQINGSGINLQINAEDEEGKSFLIGEPGREVFFGSATVFSTHVCKKLLVENHMPISVRYCWKIEDSVSERKLERGGCCKKNIAAFSANPCFGILDSNSRTSFTFTFTPNESQRFQQLASFYIDTVNDCSLQSIRWKELQEIMSSLRMQGYNVKDASKCLGISVGQLMFSGDGEPLQVEFSPPVLHMFDIVEQGQSHTTSVLLKNNSCVEISFAWQLPDVPCWMAPNLNCFTIIPMTGTVNAMDTREFQVHLKARAIGRLHEKIICQIIGGPEITLYVEGSIQGPSIQITPAILDFGIVQVGNVSSLELTLTNISNYPASFKLLAASKLPTTRTKHTESFVAADALHFNCQRQLSSTQPFYNGEDKSHSSLTEICALSSDCTLQDDYKTCQMSCPEFRFSPSEGTISAKGCTKVTVTFSPMRCDKAKWAIVCEVAGGISSSQYAIAHTLAAASEVYLSPSSIDLGITYLGLSLTTTVRLQNLSPLPCQFHWTEEVFRGFSFATIEVDPVKGNLSPHCKQDIYVKLTPIEPGEKKCTVVCQASGMMHPLELCFQLYVSDVFCRFHVEQPLKLNHTNYSKTEYSKAKLSDLKSIDRSKLPDLNFGKRCAVGVVQSLRVIVQNETAVAGKIWASVARYGIPLIQKQINELTGRPAEGNPKGTTMLHECRQFANCQFSSELGCMMSLQRQWASTCIRGVDQGLAIVLSTPEGMLQAWKSWQCEVFCYACMPGTYNDILQIKVGDNIHYQIPISIGVVGTPLVMRENSFEAQDSCRTGERRYMALEWGAVLAGCSPRPKTFWVSNSAPCNLGLEWEFYEPSTPVEECAIKAEINVEEEDQKVHVVMLGDPDKGPVQLRFEIEDVVSVHIELLERIQRNMAESSFKIHPVKQCIAPQSSVSFTVTFYSENAGTFISNLRGSVFLQGFEKFDTLVDNRKLLPAETSIIENKTQAFERTIFSPLHIGLHAVSFPPRLLTNTEETLEASFIGSDLASPGSNKLHITLSNNYDCNLCFSVAALPPFYVKVVDNENALSTCKTLSDIVLPPMKTLPLQIDFLPSVEDLTKYEDRVFHSDLVINIFDKFEQMIPMTGKLIFPQIDTFTKSIWFGAILMTTNQTIPFMIRNTSKADAHWALVHGQDETAPSIVVGERANCALKNTAAEAAAFTFDICGGVLKASSEDNITQQLVNVTFSPHNLKFYRQTVCVEVCNGRGVSIVLEGQGISEMPQEPPSPLQPPPPPKKQQQDQAKKPSTK